MLQKPFQLDVDTWKLLKILSFKDKKPMSRIVEELVKEEVERKIAKADLEKLMELI